MFEKHCGVKIVCICIDTIYIFFSTCWIFGLKEEVVNRGVEMGSQWKVCRIPLSWGSVHEWVTDVSPRQPHWRLWQFWEAGIQAREMLPDTGVLSSWRSLAFLL